MVAITAGSVDGYIRIDTRVDEKGFNKGVSKMSSGFAKLGQSLKTFAKALSIGALLIFGVALKQMFSSIRESVMNLINVNMKGSQLGKDIEGIKNQFTELKFSIATAFLPLITFAIPYIKQALDWLIRFFNQVAMITAAFFGQKEVLQVVVGSAEDLAKNTEKAKKAAQGALAAFDQINVLQGPEADTNTNVSDLPQVMTQLVPVTDEILSRVQAIKDIIASWWDDPIGKIKETWSNIAAWFKATIIDPIVEWWNNTWAGEMIANGIEAFKNILAPINGWFLVTIINPIVELFKGMWAIITDDNLTFSEKLKAIFLLIVDWIITNVTNIIVNLFKGVANTIMEVWDAIAEWFRTNVIDPLKNLFTTLWDGLITRVINAKDAIIQKFQEIKAAIIARLTEAKDKSLEVWANIADWFRVHVLDPLRNGFDIALNSIRESFSDIFVGIKDIVRGVINNIIGFINTMIDAIIGGINAVIDAANSVGSLIPGFSFINNVAPPQIPQLATGAVIPPNARFAAILGDQKSGTNIEAPADLIRQIVREELQTANGGEITVNMPVYLDSEKIYDGQKKVQTRRGPSLINSGVTS